MAGTTLSGMITKLEYEKDAEGWLRLLLSVVVCIYCVILFFILPLIVHDRYFDIGTFKYSVFFYSTLIMLALCAVLSLSYLFLRLIRKETDPVELIEALRRVNMVDKAVLIYAVCCIISYLMSPYNTGILGYRDVINPPLKGYPGWGMGLISQLFFVGIYFAVSKFTDRAFRKLIMAAFYSGSLIAFVIALLHRFSVDPFGFYEGLSEYYKLLFLSTLGQATWYSSYLCTVLPVALAMFIYEKRTRYRSFYAFYIMIASMSLVTQNSDSAYIALCAALLTLFVFALNSNNYFIRYFQLIVLILLSFRLVGLLQLVFKKRAVLPGELSLFFSMGTPMLVFTVIMVLLYLIYSLFQIKHGISVRRLMILRTIVLVISGIVFVLAISILVLSAGGVYLPYFRDIGYFNFNDEWGNGRGFTWKVTLQMFKSFPFTNKLFGAGPDCFAEYAYEFRSEEMELRWGGNVLANAHNEWLNTLFTLGVAGFISYLSIFFTAFVRFIRKRRISALTIAGAAAIASYVSHNFFGYQQVLCTPYIFAIIALCIAFVAKPRSRRRQAVKK